MSPAACLLSGSDINLIRRKRIYFKIDVKIPRHIPTTIFSVVIHQPVTIKSFHCLSLLKTLNSFCGTGSATCFYMDILNPPLIERSFVLTTSSAPENFRSRGCASKSRHSISYSLAAFPSDCPCFHYPRKQIPTTELCLPFVVRKE